MEATKILATLCNHTIKNSPLNSYFACCAQSPVNMGELPESAESQFNRMLQKLVDFKHITSSSSFLLMKLNTSSAIFLIKLYERIKSFFVNILLMPIDWMSFLYLKETVCHKNLLNVIKIVLTLSHAQSAVEVLV